MSLKISDFWPIEFVHLEKTSSTNTEAVLAGRAGKPEGFFVRANYQSEGRGRQGRVWLSKKGKALLFSFIVRGNYSLSEWSRLGLLGAISVCEALNKLNFPAFVKWPNDIFLNDKKCGGILCESFYKENFAVVGIGLNVNGSPDLEEATSLSEDLGKNLNLDFIFNLLVEYLQVSVHQWALNSGHFINLPQKMDYLSAKKVKVSLRGEADVLGKVIGVEKDGGLHLSDEKASFIIYSAEKICMLPLS